MKPDVRLHCITKLDLGPIRHIKDRPGNERPFHCRDLTVWDSNGDSFTITIYSGDNSKAEYLMTEAEKEEAAAVEPYPSIVGGQIQVAPCA